MLSLDNLANLNQYTNTCSTFEALFSYNIVPVVNENDTVAVEELRFGDNDTLSAKVSSIWDCVHTPDNGLHICLSKAVRILLSYQYHCSATLKKSLGVACRSQQQ